MCSASSSDYYQKSTVELLSTGSEFYKEIYVLQQMNIFTFHLTFSELDAEHIVYY
jgi:hypothetical protein